MGYGDNKYFQPIIPSPREGVSQLIIQRVVQASSSVHHVAYILRIPSPHPRKLLRSEVLLLKTNTIVMNVESERQQSEYSHDNTIRGKDYYYNCYGFINHCVQKAFPEAYKELVAKMLSLKETVPVSFDGLPCPFNFAMIFQELDLTYWERVTELEDIRPGDIIVYLPVKYSHRTAAAAEDTSKRTKTHVMMVQYLNERRGGSYVFSIIDCTRKAHCQEDSRYPNKTGIGTAPLYLTSTKENYTLLQWGEKEKSIKKRLFIGRLRDADRESFTSSQPWQGHFVC